MYLKIRYLHSSENQALNPQRKILNHLVHLLLSQKYIFLNLRFVHFSQLHIMNKKIIVK